MDRVATSSARLDLAAAAPIGGFYVALFLARGVASPFFPLWLRDQGYSAPQISALLAIAAFLGLFLEPAVAMLCNALVWRRSGLAAVACLGMGAFVLLAVCANGGASRLYALPVVWVLAVALSGVQLPLVDVIAVNASKVGRPHYGHYRGLGTTAYMAANLVGGGLIHALGSRLVIPWCAVMGLGAIGAALALPDREWNRCAPRRQGPPLTHVWRLFGNRMFLAVLLIGGLIECSHVYFYSFSSLIWRSEGAGPLWIGGLRAVCALAEAAFLFWLEPRTRRIDPWSLLLVGSAAALVRWLAMGAAPPFWVEAVLQSLHALSFAATLIAALRLVEQALGREQFPLGQAVCAAFIGGLVPGVATLFCGLLYEHLAGGGYFVMAGVAGLAALSTLWCGKRAFWNLGPSSGSAAAAAGVEPAA